MKTILSAALVVHSSLASAAWISGGGSLDYTANNPWFFNDTTRAVEYCVFVDEAAFGMTANEIEPAITAAIAYWKAEIQEASSLMPNFPQQIGLETYTRRQNCDINDSSIDLKLQFGILTDEQLRAIRSPEKFAGLAIRTSYDESRKKGARFIYVGAQAGALKMEHAIENPWSKYGADLLKHVLAHEFSHIFGMEHSEGIELLRKDFAMRLLSSESSASTAARRQLDYQVLAFHEAINFTCAQRGLLSRFFGTPSDSACHRFVMQRDHMEIYYSPDNVSWHLGGRVDWAPSYQIEAGTWVPFTLSLNTYSVNWVFPAVEDMSMSGTYVSSDQATRRAMHFRRTSKDDKNRLTGEMNGKIYPNLLDLPPF